MNAKTTKFLAVLAVLAMAFAAVAAIMPTEQSSAANDTVDNWEELTAAVLDEDFDVKLGADIDGSDAGAVELPNAGKIDLNGYTLTIDEVTVDKDLEIVSTAAAAAKENESVIIGAVNGEGSITLKDVSMEATVGLSNIYVAGTVEFFGNFTAEATTIAAEGIDATLNLPKKNNETSTVGDGLILEGSELNVTGVIKAENGVALETIDNPATDLVIDGDVTVSTLVEVTGKLTVGSLGFAADAANELYVRNGGVLDVKGAFTLNDAVPFDDRYGIDAGAKLICDSINAISAGDAVVIADANNAITFNSYILGKIVIGGQEYIALSFVYENKVYSYFAQTAGNQETIKAPKKVADANVNVGYLIPDDFYGKDVIGFTDAEDSKEIVYTLNSKVNVQSAGMLMYPVYYEPAENLNLSGSVKYTGPETDESKIVGATIYFKPTEGDTITAVIGEDLTFSATGFMTGTYRITIPAAANLGYVATPVGAVTFEKTDISGLVISIVKKITVSGTVDVDEDVKALMEKPEYEGYEWEIIGYLKDANENVVQTIAGLSPEDTYAFKQNYSDELKLEFVLNGTFDATTELYANYSESIIFTENMTKDIILHLPTYAISGIVYDSDDEDEQEPVVGLELQLQMQVGEDEQTAEPIYEDVEGMTATTDEEGKYVFENVLDKNTFRVVSADEHFVIAEDIGAYPNIIEVNGEDLEEKNLVATENNWVVTLYVYYNGELINVPEDEVNGIDAYWNYALNDAKEPAVPECEVTKVPNTVGTYKIQLTTKEKNVLGVIVNSYNAYGDAYKGIDGWDQSITVVLKERYYNLFGTATITGIGYDLSDEDALVSISDADATLELYNNVYDADNATNTFSFMFTGLNLGDTGTVSLRYGGETDTYAYQSIPTHVTGVQLALDFGLMAVDITVEEGIELTINGDAYDKAIKYEYPFGTEITLKATTDEEKEIELTINGDAYDAEETKYTIEAPTTIEVSFASQQTEKFVASIADDLTLVVAAYDGGIIGEGTAVVEVYKMIELAGMLIPDLIDTIEVTIDEDTSIFSEDLTEKIQAIISESGAGTYNINASVSLGEITKYSNVVAMTETAAETEA